MVLETSKMIVHALRAKAQFFLFFLSQRYRVNKMRDKRERENQRDACARARKMIDAYETFRHFREISNNNGSVLHSGVTGLLNEAVSSVRLAIKKKKTPKSSL